jgi:threonine synthase
VPSGNFGNVCAGHVARMMGLPIEQLVVATNENDVLDEFFRTGTYRVRGSAETTRPPAPRWTSPRPATSSASCSTCWAVTARAPKALFKDEDRAAGRVPPVGRRVRQGRELRFRVRHQHARRPPGHHPRHLASAFGVMIDTHTADGLKVAREHVKPGVPMLVLETAACRPSLPSTHHSHASR